MKARALLGLALGALGLWFALRGVAPGELLGAFRSLEPAWLAPIAGLFLLQQLLRAWRQQLLLAPVAPRLGLRDSLSILCISFFCINTLPLRSGELVRPLLLWEREAVPPGSALAVVLLERLLDFAAVLAMVELVLLLLPFGELRVFGSTLDLGAVLPRLALGTLLLGGTGLLAAWLARRSLRRLLERPGGRLRALLARGLELLEQALAVLGTPRRLLAVVALTAVIWGGSAWMYVWMGQAIGLGERMGYGQGLAVMSVTMLGTALPSPPGFAGVYEAFTRGTFLALGIAGPGMDARAAAYALAMHWWIFAVQASTALWFLWRDGLSLRRLLGLLRRSRGLLERGRGPPR